MEAEAQCGRRIEDHLTHLIYHMMDCEDRIQQFKTTEYSLQDDFLGSVVINLLECAAGVVLKCLEAEAAHNARRNATQRALQNNAPS